MKTFKLTKTHIKLLRRMYVRWDNCETGAPCIDPKRPYGNSDVTGDIHEILTGECVELTREQEDKYIDLHREMETALQIVLRTGKFKVGTYQLLKDYTSDWELIKT